MAPPTFNQQIETILQGVTAQTKAAQAANNTSVQNSSAVVAPGNVDPMDVTGRPGFMLPGQPGGNEATVIIQGYSGTNIHAVGAPAGTAGGGAIYPNISGASAVPNPFIKQGWTVQQTSNVFIEFAYAPATFAHNTVQTITPTLALTAGATGTFTVTVKEVNGVLTSTLPTSFTIASTTGIISLAAGTVAGVYTIGLTVLDSSGRTAEASVVVTLT